MYSKILILSACLVLAVGYNSSAQTTIVPDTSHIVNLRIDPANAMGGNASDIFEQINYIPLETTPESLFGSIAQLEITDDYYIILDNNTNSILLFDKKGKFHNRIKGASGEYFWRFTVDKWNKQIVYCTNSWKTLNFCNFDGKLVRKIDLDKAKIDGLAYFFSRFIGPNQVVGYFPHHEPDTTKKTYTPALWSMLQFGRADSLYAVAMPFTRAQGKIKSTFYSNVSQLSSSGDDATIFFAKPFDYDIYTITPNAIKLNYRLIFPLGNTLPKDFLGTDPAYENRVEYTNKHPELIHIVNNIYQVNQNLLFWAHSRGQSKEDHMIYNLKSGTLIGYKHILPDAFSYMLPVFDDLANAFMNNGIAACDGKYIYTDLSSLCMFKSHDENAEQKIKYNDVLADYFKKSTKKDNPVILQLKLKDQL